jgi:hypothetical protein
MKTLICGCVIAMTLPIVGSSLSGAAQPAAAARATITLLSRHAHVSPCRQGFTHTGGGNIDVAQPSPDTVVITMTGVAVAGGHPCKASSATMKFDLDQCFEFTIDPFVPQQARISLEGRVIGLLRSHSIGGGSAQQGPGEAVISGGPAAVVALDVPAHAVCGGENLSINCRNGPITGLAGPGQYVLHQSWCVSASHPANLLPCKAASAEFAPDPGLDPLWISYWEPFHGASKKDFGFQVVLRVTPENGR